MIDDAIDLDREPPKATIAIPTYNRANSYLQQALESALKQSYQNIEILVADNCSSDNTEQYIKKFNDTRIRYYRHPENIGANRNFNFCLQQAQGEFFLLLSDDDMIDSDFIEVCVNAALSDQSIAIVRTGIRVIGAHGDLLSERLNLSSGCGVKDFIRDWFKGKAALYLCNTLFRTKNLRLVGGFKSKNNLYDDVIAITKLITQYQMINIQDVKATTRVHKLEMGFTAKISEWCEDSLELLDLMCNSVSEERRSIRLQGNRIFSLKNYARARSISSPLKRLIAFMIIYRKFHYCYPPPIFPRSIQPRRLQQLVNMLRKMSRAG